MPAVLCADQPHPLPCSHHGSAAPAHAVGRKGAAGYHQTAGLGDMPGLEHGPDCTLPAHQHRTAAFQASAGLEFAADAGQAAGLDQSIGHYQLAGILLVQRLDHIAGPDHTDAPGPAVAWPL